MSWIGVSAATLSTLAITVASGLAPARASCMFLVPLGGGGDPVVAKQIGPDRALGRTNWNTDFVVDRDYKSYRFFFTSASSERALFPIEGFMVFTDGANLQVINETPTFNPGEGREFGPFKAVPGRRSRLMNFRVGSSSHPGSLGFSYRISVKGCE